MKTITKIFALLLCFLFVVSAQNQTAPGAELRLNPLFQDNAVLQREARVPVWGTASDGEKIIVTFDGQTVTTVATNGTWEIWLKPMKANATPQTLTVHGSTVCMITNVLVGDVWVAGGQSNMERQLGLRAGQQPITDWEQEVASAKYPEIRQFYVPQTKSFVPMKMVNGNWSVCSPETVSDFTAVGYFFSRDLYLVEHVPIGLIHSSWGGTPAEAWTSEATLGTLPDFAGPLADLKRCVADPSLAQRETQARQETWYAKVDPGSKAASIWSAPDLDISAWQTMLLPTNWENAGYPDFDGIFWFRQNFNLPENWDGAEVELHLGAADDNDTTWVNGVKVGATMGWDVPRVYRIPASVLHRTNNVIAARVLDTGGNGGLWGGGDTMRLLFNLNGQTNSISLAGLWLCKQSVSLGKVGWPPGDFSESPSAPTVLYNAMIAPLLPYAIRGVIWYQGEANVGRERQYSTLFPAMIADWRQAWGEGNFPFLFVQLAPFKGNTPELREAQLLTLQCTTNTAMVVTTDCGDANDIHPPHKQPMGARLALAARALAYREKVEYSGPIFASMKVQGKDAILQFTHLGGGLAAKDGALKGFIIAGADKIFHPARAKIRGETIVVNSPEVSQPVAIRYGWANASEGNFFNRAGLPASPFRTDVN